VLAIRCETDPPDVLIANRDGSQRVRLLDETAAQCGSIWVGDYLEIEGVKENEQLFDAEEVTIWRASRRIR